MAPDSLVFRCPACGIKLAVAPHLAGISGPCPACRATIQAPKTAEAPPAIDPHVPESGSTPLPPQATPSVPVSTDSAPALSEPAVPVATPAAEVPAAIPAIPVASAAAPDVLESPPQIPPEIPPHDSTPPPESLPQSTRVGDMWNAAAPPAPIATRRRQRPRTWLVTLIVLAGAAALAYYALVLWQP